VSGELLAAFREAAVQDEQLDPAANGYRDPNAGRPAFQQNELLGVLVQHGKFDTRNIGRGLERKGGGVGADRGPVVRVEFQSLTKIVQPGSEPGVWLLAGGFRT